MFERVGERSDQDTMDYTDAVEEEGAPEPAAKAKAETDEEIEARLADEVFL